MSMRRVSPRQTTMFADGGSLGPCQVAAQLGYRDDVMGYGATRRELVSPARRCRTSASSLVSATSAEASGLAWLVIVSQNTRHATMHSAASRLVPTSS